MLFLAGANLKPGCLRHSVDFRLARLQPPFRRQDKMRDDILSNPASVDFLSRFVKARLYANGVPQFSAPREAHTGPVVLVSYEGVPRFVIKLIPFVRRFLKIISRSRYLARRRLAVPRLLAWSFAGSRRHLRSYLLVEEFIPGRPSLGSEPDLRKLAEAFAALHSVARRNLAFIAPALKRGGYFRRGPYIRFRLRQALALVTAIQEHLPSSTAGELARTFEERARPLWRRSRHELLHGDVKRSHYVLTPDSAFMVDLDEVHFGDFASDLVPALHLLCNEQEGQKSTFLETYFRRVRGATTGDFADSEPFYHGDYHLRAAGYTVRRLREGTLNEDDFRGVFSREIACCQGALAGDA